MLESEEETQLIIIIAWAGGTLFLLFICLIFNTISSNGDGGIYQRQHTKLAPNNALVWTVGSSLFRGCLEKCIFKEL